MKQFRMVALMGLTLLMGVIMTACVGGNEETDNKTTRDVIVLYENGQLTQYGGGILTPTNPSALPAIPGMYAMTIEYSTLESDQSNLSVTILSTPASLDNNNIFLGEGVGNINLYDLEYSGGLKPEMYNQDYLLIPCIYWMEDVAAEAFSSEFKKHTFSIWAPEDLTSEDGVLNLTLVDNVTDPTLDRTKSFYSFQAFNLKALIAAFKQKNGKLTSIKVWGSTSRATYDPVEGKPVMKSVDVPYTY